MQNLKMLLAVGAGLAAVVVVACSSSSSSGPGATANTDAGDDSTTTVTDDSSAPATCIPLGGTGCAAGLECCLDLSAGLAPGMCVQPGACHASVDIGCTKGAECSSGQVCCADFGGGDGGLAALVEGGLGALGIDASALSLDAGAAGLGGLNFKVKCASSCTSSQIQACASSAECVGGGTCVQLTSLLGDASALGDAGAIPAGLGMYASALGMEMACIPNPGDAATTAPDTGTVDAVAPTDAPADAVSE